MKLAYKAVTQDGKTVRGLIEAKTVQDAGAYLRSRDLLPIHIAPSRSQSLLSYLPFIKPVNENDVIFFTRQLSSMLVSGLTLVQSLHILRDQVTREGIKKVISDIIIDIEEGRTFFQALEKYPDVFSPVYISLIKAAETSGLLDKILIRLAENLEKGQKLKSTIKSALLYPIIVIAGMIVVVIIMMIFVIPQLGVLYKSLNIELPLPTRIVMGMSSLFIVFWPFMLGIFATMFIAFNRWHKTETGKLIIDNIVLKLPVFGNLIKQEILTEFTRTFGLLVGSGTLVVEALNQASDVAGNIVYKNDIINVGKRVEKGVSVSDALSAYSLFPPIIVQMVGVGEQTGKLDESLTRVSEYYEHEVEVAVKNLTTAMEPIIMVVLGIGVAFLVISVITPIYSLINAIQ